MKCTNISFSFAALILGAAVVGFLGCKASEAPTSGFTEKPELMTKSATTPFQKTYWNKDFDQHAYTELLVAPVNTDYVLAENFWEKASAANLDPEKVKKNVKMIADYTQQAFIDAANNDPKHRFKVVQTAGPKTLILELAIVQIVPSKAVLNAIGYVTWVPTVVQVAGSTGTKSEDTGKGVIAIEGRVRDGASGEIIGMFADRERPKTSIVDLQSLNWWAPAKAIVDEWAQQLIAVANRPPGGVVKDSPSFELLTW
jgi:hypothetical protein